MNKQQTALKVRDTMRKYREQGSDSPCRRNHIIPFANNTPEHEAMKCAICYNLLKGKIPYMKTINKGTMSGMRKCEYEESPDFKTLSYITEAVDRRTGKRRDVVILELDQIIEVVNTHESDELMSEYARDDVLIIKV